ncbi:MAG: cytochrome b/b6 domain-containing protein [Nitrospinae bacterium]|nr:cytochrome b/b6 domain-containing protein [Nitrospinota bacterium]
METEETPQKAPEAPAYPYSSLLRITHWLNVPLLLLMMASGFQIWWAYPAFGPDMPNPEAIYEALRGAETRVDPRAINLGADYRVFVQGLTKTFGIGEWLAGALRWHFALMWPYTINGLIFLLLLLLTEEGRHYRIKKADFAGAKEMLLHPVRTFHHPPGEGKFNPIQKIAYNVVILAGILSVLTGLAILKPVQLGWLTWLFGGYQPSRLLHFLVMLFLVVFMIGHFLMVISHGWRRGLAPMIVGIKAERDAFRARQRQFAKNLGRVAEEAAILVVSFWLGGLVAVMMNAVLGGEASGAWFGAPGYLLVRFGLMRGQRAGDFWRKAKAGS